MLRNTKLTIYYTSFKVNHSVYRYQFLRVIRPQFINTSVTDTALASRSKQAILAK